MRNGAWNGRTINDVLGVTRAAAVMLGVVLMAAVAAGCDSLDPTVQLFRIHFRNDLGTAVRMTECNDTNCDHLSDTWVVPPRTLTDDTISDREVTTSWLVTKRDRTVRRGCIVLNFNGRWNEVVVRLSQLQPCATARPLSIDQVQHGSHQGGMT
jgi:hypothetical protein